METTRRAFLAFLGGLPLATLNGEQRKSEERHLVRLMNVIPPSWHIAAFQGNLAFPVSGNRGEYDVYFCSGHQQLKRVRFDERMNEFLGVRLQEVTLPTLNYIWSDSFNYSDSSTPTVLQDWPGGPRMVEARHIYELRAWRVKNAILRES